ncbi:MAG: radical SAM protein [Candidatus Omnitrophota bacterium]
MEKLYFQWHITNTCNLRCRHCYQDDFTPHGELDWDGLKKICSRISAACAKNGGASIDVTGGEPFLKKEFFKLLEHLDTNKEISQLGIITNATKIDEGLAESLGKFKKLQRIKISLDGAKPKTNDYVRGEGAFERIQNGIEILKKKTRLPLILMFTAMKHNVGDMAGILKLAKDMGAQGVIVERFFPTGLGTSIKEELLDKKSWRELINTLLELSGARYDDEEILPLRAFWVKFGAGKLEISGAACNVGRDAFAIMPNGDVYPCRRFNLKIGNLTSQPLAEIIDSSLVLKDLEAKRRKGKCGECNIERCRGCAALTYLLKGDYLAEDTQCWYNTPRI